MQYFQDLFPLACQPRFINIDQHFVFKDKKSIFKCIVTKITHIDDGFAKYRYGVFEDSKDIVFKVAQKSKAEIQIEDEDMQEREIFKGDFDFVKLGIGGLDAQAEVIFRKAFNNRRYPPAVLKKYGQSHVKGILLHGPPGTGKTLIARKIAEALNCRKPK